MGFDAAGAAEIDDDLLEEAQVVVEAEAEAVEIENGVGNELAGAVVGDVAAAVGLFEMDAMASEEFWRGFEVRRGAMAARDGDDGRVFEEEEGADVGTGRAGGARVEEAADFVELACVGVGV